MIMRLAALAFVWFATGILATIGAQDIYTVLHPQPRLLGTTTVYTQRCPSAPITDRAIQPAHEARI